ncbi:hypothetical protein D3C74_488160 [compost metagenome]
MAYEADPEPDCLFSYHEIKAFTSSIDKSNSFSSPVSIVTTKIALLPGVAVSGSDELGFSG